LEPYYNKTYNFTLKKPGYWKTEQGKNSIKLSCNCKTTDDEGKETDVQAQLIIVAELLPKAITTIEEYINLVVIQLEKMLVKLDSIKRDKTTLGGMEVHRLRYSSDSMIKDTRYTQHFTMKDGKVFILTFSCNEDPTDDSFHTTMSRVLNTFRFEALGTGNSLGVIENLNEKFGIPFNPEKYSVQPEEQFGQVQLIPLKAQQPVVFMFSTKKHNGDLNGFSKALKKQNRSGFGAVEPNEERDFMLGALPGKLLSYPIEKMKLNQVFALSPAGGFALTFCLLAEAKNFDDYWREIIKYLDSLYFF